MTKQSWAGLTLPYGWVGIQLQLVSPAYLATTLCSISTLDSWWHCSLLRCKLHSIELRRESSVKNEQNKLSKLLKFEIGVSGIMQETGGP